MTFKAKKNNFMNFGCDSSLFVQSVRRVLILAWCFMAIPTWAVETASVLPAGISRARLVTVVTDKIEETYNAEGLIEPVGAVLNRSITTKDFTDKSPQLKGLVDVLNSIEPKLGEKLLNANIFSSFELHQRVIMPAYEYGVNERFSVGIRVPVVTQQLTSNFSAIGTNNAGSIAALSGNLSPQLLAGLSEVEKIQLSTSAFENNLFLSKGYEVPQGYSRTDLGDVEVGGKFNFIKSDLWMVTVVSGVKIPTGKPASLTNIYKKGTGKEAWALGVKFIEEFNFHPQWKLAASQNVESYYSDSRQRAVPLDETDSLPSLLAKDGQVQEVIRNQAPFVELEVGVEGALFDNAITTWGGLTYAVQGHSNYSGDGDLYYDGLSVNTNRYALSSEVGLAYSSIAAYKKGDSAIPYEVQGRINAIIEGENTPISNYFRLDTIFYF